MWEEGNCQTPISVLSITSSTPQGRHEEDDPVEERLPVEDRVRTAAAGLELRATVVYRGQPRMAGMSHDVPGCCLLA